MIAMTGSATQVRPRSWRHSTTAAAAQAAAYAPMNTTPATSLVSSKAEKGAPAVTSTAKARKVIEAMPTTRLAATGVPCAESWRRRGRPTPARDRAKMMRPPATWAPIMHAKEEIAPPAVMTSPMPSAT